MCLIKKEWKANIFYLILKDLVVLQVKTGKKKRLEWRKQTNNCE